MDMMKKTWTASVEIEGKPEGVIVAAISTDTVDRDGDIIDPAGLKFGQYMKNPVVLADHNYTTDNVIARAERLWVEGGKLMAIMQFDMSDPKAAAIYRKYANGFLKAFSIGFMPVDYERTDTGYHIREAELLEFSAVAVPANPEALAVEVRSAISEVEKGAVSYQNLPLDMNRSWDAAAAKARVAKWASSDGSGDKDKINWAKYRRAFCWYDEKNPDNFGAYKLPIADVINGELTAIWRGVVSAMAAILGARGGVDIPENDRRAVYNHLTRYYKKADKEPPEFRDWAPQEFPVPDDMLETMIQEVL